jgi:hypothetical protein
MISILSADTGEKAPYTLGTNIDLDLFMSRDFNETGGYALTDKFPAHVRIGIEEIMNDYRYPADYFVVGSLNIVSQRLREAFVSTEVEMEFFPVEIIPLPGYPADLQPYFAANLLNRVKAIDEVRSDMVRDPEHGLIEYIDNLVLKEEAFKGIKIAVIDEIAMIGVQPEVAEAIERSGCTGIVCVDPATVKF